MKSSTPSQPFQAFMAGLIDYAGLFPPASLDLTSALDEYGAYLPSADSWMLGRFIIPAADLSKLPILSAAWRFSVLGRSGKDADEFLRNLEVDLADVQAFRQTQPATADIFEVRLPSDILSFPTKLFNLLNQTSQQITNQHKLTTFYEIPLEDAWRENMAATVAALSQQNERNSRRSGFKIRCGGVVAHAFPTVDQVAHALLLCRDHRVPFKATAGLHHPIRHYNESVQTKMHGFINVFGAAILARAYNLSLEQTIEILKEEDPRHFDFNESYFAWKNLSTTSEEIADARKSQFIAYGSCSFDEPREDMQKMGWL